MSTLRTTNIKNPDSIGNNLILDESGGVVISGVTTVTTLNATQITGGVVISGVTTVSNANITGGSITGISTVGVTTVTTTNLTVNGNAYPTAGPLSNRNLIINGDMSIAQRGTSSTTSGYATVDRWINSYGSGTVTQSQESLTSGDPYDEGFRNFFRVTNTSASASPTTESQTFLQYIEGYNIASSGWNYKSPSSYVTLSFWVRSSLAGTYYGKLGTFDGTNYAYPFSITLSANTWTKVTKTIPGNSNLTLDNDNGGALGVYITSYYGTNNTDSGVSLETWAAFNAATQYPDFPQNWKGTASATFDITGVQLEVGEVATPFEHRSYGDELARCQRYYQLVEGAGAGLASGSTGIFLNLIYSEMRSAPSIGQSSPLRINDASNNFTQSSTSITSSIAGSRGAFLQMANFTGLTQYRPFILRDPDTQYFTLSSEL